jgi:MYXO-CTERM domain-containing protein
LLALLRPLHSLSRCEHAGALEGLGMASRLLSVSATIAIVGLASGFGCGTSAQSESTRSSSANIQGGSLDSTHTFELGVCIGARANCNAICTGTLIAPNLVATARHCVSDVINNGPNGTVDCSMTSFSGQYAASTMWVTTNESIFTPTGTWAQGARIVTPGPTLLCGNDIALIILSSNIPASAATPATPNVMYDLRDRTYISKLMDTAIGYGLTAPNSNTAGDRHIRQDIQFNCIPGDRFYDCAAHGYTDIANQEFFSGDGPCEGDSGSGAFSQAQFDQGQFLSLGVLSRGGVSQDGTTCVGSIYTRLDQYRDLIIQTAQQAAQMGGYTPPAWVNSPPIQPPGDGGTHPQPDASTSGSDSGSSGALGDPCADDSQCTTMACRALNGGANVCSQSCDSMNACPSGFVCKFNYCFADPGSGSGNQTQSSGSSGGCAVATSSSVTDPSQPTPWFAGIALAIAATVRRRRR